MVVAQLDHHHFGLAGICATGPGGGPCFVFPSNHLSYAAGVQAVYPRAVLVAEFVQVKASLV